MRLARLRGPLGLADGLRLVVKSGEWRQFPTGPARAVPSTRGTRRIPGLYERRRANGSIAYEARLRRNGGSPGLTVLDATTKSAAIAELEARTDHGRRPAAQERARGDAYARELVRLDPMKPFCSGVGPAACAEVHRPDNVNPASLRCSETPIRGATRIWHSTGPRATRHRQVVIE